MQTATNPESAIACLRGVLVGRIRIYDGTDILTDWQRGRIEAFQDALADLDNAVARVAR